MGLLINFQVDEEVVHGKENKVGERQIHHDIVLLSSFDVDSSGGDGSLNPNSTYSDWKWILVRTDGGKWQHVDHGY